ncbi:Cysteinyl-tRNA synthetase [Hordeum vulgare]|nr:Cysteinyl-tRNA synthetase [Hordeum vulgare]
MGQPPDSHELEEEKEEQPEEELPEAMEEDEAGQPPSYLNMAEVEAEFTIPKAEEMVEQQAIVDSIRDEADMEANRMLI